MKILCNENVLQREMRSIAIKLRKAYYATHCEEPKISVCAFGGKPTESIGAFAEYNLRGCHCRRSKAGLCTPCFYSKFPDIIGIRDYTKYLIEQIDKLIDDFDSAVIDKKSGEIYYDSENLFYKDCEPIALCITPVGSFFDSLEFSEKARTHLLRRLVKKSDELSRDIILYVETHVLDFINWSKCNITNEILLMKRLHLRIVFGFESKHEFTRNVLYGKSIDLKDFELAVKRVKKYELTAYAFVFAGLYPMSHNEIISDVKDSFLYLKKLDVVPVLMFANVQEYTVGDLLVKNGYVDLINPITVLMAMKIMLDIFGRKNIKGHDAWLIADPVGGPPKPAKHIFSGNEVKCCSNKIYRLIKELRANHEFSLFENEYRKIMSCKEHKAMFEKLIETPKDTLIKRTERMIMYVDSQIDNYVKNMRHEELIYTKATLLCQGVYADKKTSAAMKSLGVSDGFIHSSNLLLDNVPINACMMEHFVTEPNCSITYSNEKFYLHRRNVDSVIPDLVGNVDFIRIPGWCRKEVAGHVVGDYLRPHSFRCISVWPNQVCGLKEDKCKFCSLSGTVILSPDIVFEMVDIALQSNPTYDIHLSGGVYKDIENNEDYYSEIAYLIHSKYPTTKISLETTPPLSKKGMQKYKRSGISSLIMNLEIADETFRKKICVGKSHIPLTRYFEAFEEGVNFFGKWNVASVLLWGFDEVSKETFISCVKKICSIGVYPVIMPFQPLKGCALHKREPTDVESFIEISTEVGKIIAMELKNQSICKFGCINCGACSIENNLIKENRDENFNY